MRRSTQVLLVLMGGGVVGAAAIPLLRGPDCDVAVQVGGRCPDSGLTSHTSSSSHWSGGSSGGHSTGTVAGAAVAGAVAGAAIGARGGFGSTGSAHASSSGG